MGSSCSISAGRSFPVLSLSESTGKLGVGMDSIDSQGEGSCLLGRLCPPGWQASWCDCDRARRAPSCHAQLPWMSGQAWLVPARGSVALGYHEPHHEPLASRTLSPCSRSTQRSWLGSFRSRRYWSPRWCQRQPAGRDHSPAVSGCQALLSPDPSAAWTESGVAIRTTCGQCEPCSCLVATELLG